MIAPRSQAVAFRRRLRRRRAGGLTGDRTGGRAVTGVTSAAIGAAPPALDGSIHGS
jgi:hypothetical protein